MEVVGKKKNQPSATNSIGFEDLKEKRKNYDTYYDCLFTDYFTPWFRLKKCANVYDAIRREVDELAEHRNKKSQKGQKARSGASTAEDIQSVKALSLGDKQRRPVSGQRNPKQAAERQPPKPLPQQHQQQQQHTPRHEDPETQKLIMTKYKYKQKIDDLRSDIVDADIELRQKKQHIKMLQEELKNSRHKVEELTSRLSKLAGDKMRDNNPDIADLSDPNRPTELGKHFSELYDNEWSDAFEEIKNKNDNDKIQTLYTIMQESFKFCNQKQKTQTGNIQQVLLASENEVDEELPINMHNILKDTRKKLGSLTAVNVGQAFANARLGELCQLLGIPKAGENLRKFGMRCAELSWLMVICDPPMALSDCKKGDKFSPDKYKAYTQSEKGMKYPVIGMLVWPCLHLTDGGPLAAKGVAQPGERDVVKSGGK